MAVRAGAGLGAGRQQSGEQAAGWPLTPRGHGHGVQGRPQVSPWPAGHCPVGKCPYVNPQRVEPQMCSLLLVCAHRHLGGKVKSSDSLQAATWEAPAVVAADAKILAPVSHQRLGPPGAPGWWAWGATTPSVAGWAQPSSWSCPWPRWAGRAPSGSRGPMAQPMGWGRCIACGGTPASGLARPAALRQGLPHLRRRELRCHSPRGCPHSVPPQLRGSPG